MVELKAIINLEDVHLAQAMNYVESYNLEIGLLINFGTKSLQFKRMHNSNPKGVRGKIKSSNQESSNQENLKNQG